LGLRVPKGGNAAALPPFVSNVFKLRDAVRRRDQRQSRKLNSIQPRASVQLAAEL
jgi:hypothetical protein